MISDFWLLSVLFREVLVSSVYIHQVTLNVKLLAPLSSAFVFRQILVSNKV